MEGTSTITRLLGVGKIIKGRMEHELPLALSQCETLRVLEKQKRLTMRALAAHFKITAPSATAIVNELVKAALVVRAENSHDRREVVLSLTPKGRAVLRSIEEHRKKIIAGVLSVLSDTDRTQLDIILQKIITHEETQ